MGMVRDTPKVTQKSNESPDAVQALDTRSSLCLPLCTLLSSGGWPSWRAQGGASQVPLGGATGALLGSKKLLSEDILGCIEPSHTLGSI